MGNSFTVKNPSAGTGQDIWFTFNVTNTTDGDISYAVLAAHTDAGPNAKSWTNDTLKAHKTLDWTDHININTPGTYQLYLGICYGDKNVCLANQVTWDRLSGNITVTVQ